MDQIREHALSILRDLDSINYLAIAAVLCSAWILKKLVDIAIPWVTGRLAPGWRLRLLPLIPFLRLVIILGSALLILPMVVRPTAANLIALASIFGIVLGFAFKEYATNLLAGVVVVFEKPYRPGDFVRIGDAYGEVLAVNHRSLRLVTPDDTVVTIPHGVIWKDPVYNANDGKRTLLCVATWHLVPEHDSVRAREILRDTALSSPFLDCDRPVSVIVAETPLGTHYALKAYPVDSRDQFDFLTDLSVRGKAALLAAGFTCATADAAIARAGNTGLPPA